MTTLFLAWQDPKTRSWFPIGRLTFDGECYQFIYTQGVKRATEKCNFSPLYSFPKLGEIYRSVHLFPLFSNRLMRPSRPDYKNYIEWLNIPENQDDPITILSRSGGKKVTDYFEVFPLPEPDENNLYHIHFFSHGLRHFPPYSLERVNKLNKNEPLFLVHDLQNPYDHNALILRTEDLYNVGYCPRYLTQDIHQLLPKNPKSLSLQVERVNLAPTPLQLRLLCNLTAEWPPNFNPCSADDYQPLISTRV